MVHLIQYRLLVSLQSQFIRQPERFADAPRLLTYLALKCAHKLGKFLLNSAFASRSFFERHYASRDNWYIDTPNL